MSALKKISLVIMIVGYALAGINHFRSPQGYYHIMPPYLRWPVTLNILAGMFEILFALLLIFRRTRPFAALGIILMLLAFVSVHIYMVQQAPMKMGDITVTPLIAWLRLVVLQPLLIAWAGWYVKRRDIIN